MVRGDSPYEVAPTKTPDVKYNKHSCAWQSAQGPRKSSAGWGVGGTVVPESRDSVYRFPEIKSCHGPHSFCPSVTSSPLVLTKQHYKIGIDDRIKVDLPHNKTGPDKKILTHRGKEPVNTVSNTSLNTAVSEKGRESA